MDFEYPESEREQRNSGLSRSAHTPIKRISEHRDTISCHSLCCTNDLIDMKGRCCPKIVLSIPRSLFTSGQLRHIGGIVPKTALPLWRKVCEQGKSEGFYSCDRPSNLTQIGFKWSIFKPVWPWNLMDDHKKQYGTSSRCYFKLFASFRSHWWIQTGVTILKRLIWVKIDDFFSRVTLKFDEWPSKTIGHLFSGTSSFVQHFVAIGRFKLELQSGNP